VTGEEHFAASEGLVADEIPVADEEHVAGRNLLLVGVLLQYGVAAADQQEVRTSRN
jgi:hypothetical protein